MQMFRARAGWLSFSPLILVLLAMGSRPSALRAQTDFDGKYRCVRVEIGDQKEPCQSPPLILDRDGSYEIWGERGTYEVVQQWLVLSHSKRRGLGHFIAPGEIVFQYKINGKECRVTFRQVYDPPPGFDLG